MANNFLGFKYLIATNNFIYKNWDGKKILG